MYVKVDFEFGVKNSEKFHSWLESRPKGFDVVVMSKDQI